MLLGVLVLRCFLFPDNIPFCGSAATFYLFFFSFELWGCLYSLSVRHNAAVNICV